MRSALLVALVVASGCAAQVPIRGDLGALPRWCFGAVVREVGQLPYRAVGCWDTEALCRRALASAARLGRLVGVERLSACGARR